jgi:hypothetical protein
VLGSTGNVYSVHVGDVVSCDCPDAAKGNVCKHRMFVLVRVLGAAQASPLVYQDALLPSERAQLFGNGQPWAVCGAVPAPRRTFHP